MPRITKYKDKIQCTNIIETWYSDWNDYIYKKTCDIYSILENDKDFEGLFPSKCTNEYFGKFVDVKDINKEIKGE
jgi:hypothetical protein